MVDEHLPKVLPLHIEELRNAQRPVKCHRHHVVPPNIRGDTLWAEKTYEHTCCLQKELYIKESLPVPVGNQPNILGYPTTRVYPKEPLGHNKMMMNSRCTSN